MPYEYECKVVFENYNDEGYYKSRMITYQAFFTEDVDNLHYHEICIYFLMDITDTDLLSKGENFTAREGHRTHTFEWLAFDRLKDEYFYPLFLKKDIFNLPNVFTIRTEME